MGIDTLTVVATAAAREAPGWPGVSGPVLAQTGLKIWVVDGDEEARLSAQGVLLGWPDAKGIVCDIGGNSMELGENRRRHGGAAGLGHRWVRSGCNRCLTGLKNARRILDRILKDCQARL